MTRNLGFVAASRGHRFRRWLAGLVAVASTVTIANLELAHPRPDARTGSANDVAFPSPSEAGAAAAAVPDTTLRTLAAARGLRVGTAVHATPLANEAAYRDKVAQEFNSVTAEDQNWARLEPVRGQYDWSREDAIVEFAGEHNQTVRGHALVWHRAVPTWLANGDFTTAEVRSILRQHITDTVSRYAGRIHAWDVVNEAFNDDGTLHQDSFWYQRLGAGYIADAFRSARAADPTARLFINEYNIERINSKSTALYEYVRGLRDDGVSIDGVGFQNHITVNNELTGFTDNLQRVTGLGSDRHFQLVANHSRRCVDVVARSTADGARIQQWGCHANPTTYRNQVFRLPNAPGGHP